VEIDKGSWPILPIFKLMQEIGNVSEAEMYRTFNMGVGMVVVCAPEDQQSVTSHLSNVAECFEIGRVVNGERNVKLI
jgi:phosphoribosylformylglycinamidine cyclo-ligase